MLLFIYVSQELQQVVKLGRASEMAREIAMENGSQQASDALLSDYTPSINNIPGRTPRTPSVSTDKVLQVIKKKKLILLTIIL